MQEKHVQLFSTRIRAATYTTVGLNLGSVYPEEIPHSHRVLDELKNYVMKHCF